MGYAKHVGRVGALAVALGIGTAVITTPGIAWADDPGTDGDNPPAESTTDPTPPDNDAPADGGAAHHETTTTTTTTTGVSGTTTVIGGGSTPQVTISHSGSVDESETPQSTPAPTPDPSTIPSAAPTLPNPVVVTPTAEPSTVAAERFTPPPTPTAIIDPPADPSTPSATAALLTVVPTHYPEVPQTFARKLVVPSNPLQANRFNALVAPPPPPPPVQPQPTLADAIQAIPGAFLSAALNLITQALAPLIGPGAPADNPVLWAVLAFVRRQFNQGFANSTPVLSPQQSSQDIDDNQVHGTFGAVDPDGDVLTYSVPTTGVGAPTNGTVTIDQATGTYTYTPNAGYTGADYFYVTATDEGAGRHIHGLGQTHAAAALVTVNVADLGSDTPPGATVSYGAADPDTGAVVVTVIAKDPDGDTINSVTVTQPAGARGTLSAVSAPVYDEDADTYAYQFTYTPDPLDRVAAYVSADELRAALTVNVTAGTATTPIAAAVTIDPLSSVQITLPPGTEPTDRVITAADGTLYITTSTIADDYFEPDARTYVTIVHPDGTQTVSDPIPGYGQYGSTLDPTTGVVYVSTYVDDTDANPGHSVVAVVAPDGTTTVVPGISGEFAWQRVVVDSVRGTAYFVTSDEPLANQPEPLRTYVTILHPDGSATPAATVEGLPYESDPLGFDPATGTAYLVTSRNNVNAGDVPITDVTAIHPDGTSSLVAEALPGDSRGRVVVNPVTGARHVATVVPDDPSVPYSTVHTVVASINPGGSVVTSDPIPGNFDYYDLSVDPLTGAVYTSTSGYDANAGAGTTHITRVNPDGTVTPIATQPGVSDAEGIVFNPVSGLGYEVTTTDDATYVTIIRPDGTTIAVEPLSGYGQSGLAIDPATGVTYLTTADADEPLSTVHIINPDGTTVVVAENLPGYAYSGVTVHQPTGSLFVQGDADLPTSEQVTYVTIIRPSGSVVTDPGLPGDSWNLETDDAGVVYRQTSRGLWIIGAAPGPGVDAVV